MMSHAINGPDESRKIDVVTGSSSSACASNEKRMRVHEPNLKEDVLQTDGLFGLLASFCDARTMLRLCTLTTKSQSEHRSQLAMSLSVPKDPRRTKIVSDENWADVLRERMMLDRPLRVTAMHPFCKSRFTFDQYIMNTLGTVDIESVENTLGVREGDEGNEEYFLTIEGAICAGPYIMREGVHRAVVTYYNGRYGYIDNTCCMVGIARPDLARKEPYFGISPTRNWIPTYCSNKSDFVASAHTDFGKGFYGGCKMDWEFMGIELDLEARTLKFYERKNEEERWSAPRGTALNGLAILHLTQVDRRARKHTCLQSRGATVLLGGRNSLSRRSFYHCKDNRAI